MLQGTIDEYQIFSHEQLKAFRCNAESGQLDLFDFSVDCHGFPGRTSQFHQLIFSLLYRDHERNDMA